MIEGTAMRWLFSHLEGEIDCKVPLASGVYRLGVLRNWIIGILTRRWARSEDLPEAKRWR